MLYLKGKCVMRDFFCFAETLISGMLPFVFLVFSGIYFTVKSNFFQFKYLPSSVAYALGSIFKKRKKGEVTPFQAACTALSATVGTGNIAGVAGALSLGGAGAVFWMWVSAFAGMIIKVAEIVLSLNYREKKDGVFVGGPMYYIKNGLPIAFKPLAAIFAVCGIFAVFTSGNLTQTNAAIASVGGGTAVKVTGGIVFAAVTAAVLTGGNTRIGAFTEKIVPLMAALYIVMTFGVIGKNLSELPHAFGMIIKGAFCPKAVTGGVIGSFTAALVNGASRGVFSNEAGLGTSAMAHSASDNTDGVNQSLYGIFEVFTDTVVICTLTALTVLCSGIYINYGATASTELVNEAFSVIYGDLSGALLALMMCLFGLSSVIGWGYYGTVCCSYVFGNKGKRLFVFIYPAACIIGAVCSADTAWRLSAFFNGIMLCVNTFAVMLLSSFVNEKLNNFSLKKV
ncbi:MAG TPA: sodium:alanine symporter family protein [Ruminococcaceae bacterium]|nr:sodium:alanine symporter family protein [Oscillospiraceae bacterium]